MNAPCPAAALASAAIVVVDTLEPAGVRDLDLDPATRVVVGRHPHRENARERPLMKEKGRVMNFRDRAVGADPKKVLALRRYPRSADPGDSRHDGEPAPPRIGAGDDFVFLRTTSITSRARAAARSSHRACPLGLPVDELRNLYATRGAEMFDNAGILSRFRYKYDSERLTTMLQKVFGRCPGPGQQAHRHQYAERQRRVRLVDLLAVVTGRSAVL